MTKTVYIDFTQSVPTKHYKYHGGGNYTKRLLSVMDQLQLQNHDIYILWPTNFIPRDDEEERIYHSSKFKIIELETLDDSFIFNQNSILFFPLLNIRNWKIAKKLKTKNPNLSIYITVHGLRLLDLKPDRYDGYLLGLPLYSLYSWFLYLVKSTLYRKLVKKYIPYFDKIFTDSNYSLQQIVSIKEPNFINVYYLGINKWSETVNSVFKEKFALFVGANRTEKNFIRTLEAFISFKKKDISDLHLYVTGVDKQMEARIHKYFLPNSAKLIQKFVRFFEYIDYEMLGDLYKQCSYLIYTSKSEGFGFPILEALFCEKPILASYLTSIPEIAASTVYYINPYNIMSIENGFNYYSNKETIRFYMSKITMIKPLIEERIKIEQDLFFADFLK